MSLQLINQYQAKLERLIAYGGSRNETSVRAAFEELLDRYASSKNLALVTELDYKTQNRHDRSARRHPEKRRSARCRLLGIERRARRPRR